MMMSCSRKKKSRFDLTPCWWRPWNELPQDIQCLIIHSKNLSFTDKVRFRAVCKHWCIPKDHIKNTSPSSAPAKYPWLIYCLPNYDKTKDEVNHSFRFKLLDPQDYKSSIVSKSIEKSSYKSVFHPLTSTYASKFGWRLHGNVQGRVWSLFFHNPFSNDHIVLPPLLFPRNGYVPFAATFTASPSSLEGSCEVLVLFYGNRTLNIGRYKYNRNGDADKVELWTTQLLDQQQTTKVSVHYMDRKLYCLCYGNIKGLYCYSLADETWKLVIGPIRGLNLDFWLTQIGSSLAMVSLSYTEWRIFKFDFSLNRVIDVVEDLRNIAFFVVKDTIISLPSENDDCLIFHSGTNCCNLVWNEICCYSFKKKVTVIPPEPYPSLAQNCDGFNFGFVEPPFPL